MTLDFSVSKQNYNSRKIGFVHIFTLDSTMLSVACTSINLFQFISIKTFITVGCVNIDTITES